MFNIGDKVWTTSHTEEANSHGACDAVQPWLGVVTKVLPGDRATYRVCAVSTLFPEGYDSDSNASAYTSSVYATREEAMGRYLVDLRKDLEASLWKVDALRKLIIKTGKEVAEYPTTDEPIKNYIQHEIYTLENQKD